jgi:hypothetical protein
MFRKYKTGTLYKIFQHTCYAITPKWESSERVEMKRRKIRSCKLRSFDFPKHVSVEMTAKISSWLRKIYSADPSEIPTPVRSTNRPTPTRSTPVVLMYITHPYFPGRLLLLDYLTLKMKTLRSFETFRNSTTYQSTDVTEDVNLPKWGHFLLN